MVEEKLEFGVGSAEGFELGGFEGRRLAKNPRGDAGFEVFVRDCVEVFHLAERVIFFFNAKSRRERKEKRDLRLMIVDFGFLNERE
jgi:hypothetical protein